jgi:plasmid stabilization system protein ParE
MKLVFSKEASADLGRLRDFIAQHDPDSAARISTSLLEAIDHLEAYPKMGHPVSRAPSSLPVRDLIAGRYVVRYLLLTQQIVILRVWHHKEQERDVPPNP